VGLCGCAVVALLLEQHAVFSTFSCLADKVGGLFLNLLCPLFSYLSGGEN